MSLIRTSAFISRYFKIIHYLAKGLPKKGPRNRSCGALVLKGLMGWLFEERQDALGSHISLSQHGSTRLEQNLVLRKGRHF